MTLGEFSIALSIGGTVPYIVQVVRGSVRPERTSWFVWALILALAVSSYHAAGARDSIWFLVGDLIATTAIFLLSLWRGQGGWTRLDIVCLSIAGTSLALWQFSSIPLFALWGSLIADVVAAIPTIVKAWHDPGSESASTYAFSAVAALCGLLAVSAWTFNLLFYPAYLFVVNLAIAMTVGIGQYAQRRAL